ncbi:MAG: hypothetical protein D6753_11080 [Planctomycetota bacterium]|nr:MAG: hypothetical protein D6753_11080 [Planctomycetota bacterium]
MMHHLPTCRYLAQLLVIAGTCLVAPLARGEFPAIELHGWSRMAVQQDRSIRLRPLGQRLEELDRLLLWPSGLVLPVLRQPPGPLQDVGPSTGAFHLDASHLAAGIYEARVAGRFGLSNPRRLLVTRQPVHRVEGDISHPGLARDAAPGKIYEDLCAPRGRRYFRIALQKGQRLEAVVYAPQLDSRTIGRLILTDAAGQELSKGVAVRQWPARVVCDAPADGDYYLAVHDALYRGGEHFGYLLELSRSESGNPAPLELDTLLLPVLDPNATASRLKYDLPARVWGMALRPPQPVLQLNSFLGASPDRPSLDRPDSWWIGDWEPTDLLAEHPSQDLDRPASAAPGVEFSARQGQPLWIEVQSSQWSQLTDPHVLIYQIADQSGRAIEPPKLLAERNDGTTLGPPDMRLIARDPMFPWSPPTDGRFRCVVQDDQGGRRPTRARRFLLEVRPPRPDFAALAWPLYPHNNAAAARPSGLQVMRGGTAAVRLIVARRDGFNAPLLAQAIDLPPGVHSSIAWIAPGQMEGTVILTGDDDAPQWTGPIRIVVAQPDQPLSRRQAIPATVVWGATPERNGIESRLCGTLGLHVLASDTAPISVRLGEQTLASVRAGKKLAVPIRLVRREGAQADCILRPQQLPPKVGLGEVRVGGKSSDATAELTVAADAPPGRYTFWMLAETQVKWRANPQSVARIEAYLQTLRQALEQSSDATRRELESAIEQQSAALEKARQAAAEQQLTVWIPSTPLELEILPPES